MALSSVLNISDVPLAIQMALGPAFLLTAIAGMLNVMMGRLARIIDRGRDLLEGPLAEQMAQVPALRIELLGLERRRALASKAIAACTFAALTVCMVIASLFLEVLLGIPLKWLVSLLFTFGMLALVVGLSYFLREVSMASATVRLSLSEAQRSTL